jgi:hypothetical protein
MAPFKAKILVIYAMHSRFAACFLLTGGSGEADARMSVPRLVGKARTESPRGGSMNMFPAIVTVIKMAMDINEIVLAICIGSDLIGAIQFIKQRSAEAY